MHRLCVLIMLSVSGCTWSGVRNVTENDVPSSAFQSTDPSQVTIAVVGINDFHGSILPRERKLKTSSGEVLIRSGGAPALASMLSILRKEMNGRVLLVDAGDEWQGTLESNQVKGKTVVDYFNRIGMKVAAIGNHEFDFNLAEMTSRFQEAKYPYVSANIFEKNSGKHPNWKNYAPTTMIEISGIRFGVIGLSTVNTPGTTRYEYVKHLDFREPAPIVLKESKALREKGANAVLVTAHAGTFCDRKRLNDWRLLSRSTEQGKCESEEISMMAAAVGPQHLDGIISGHTHQVIHHWISGIPTVQDEAYNQHFNVIYYTFNKKTGKLIQDMTRVEGLIPICEQTFKGLNHCDVRRLPEGKVPELEPSIFHGQPVVADPAIVDWMKPIIASTEKFRNEVVGFAELPLLHHRDQESPFGNLVADALRESGHADFAIINSGGIRTSLDAGKLTLDAVFRALPFDNMLNTVKMKGKDIKLMYRIASAGTHGVPPVSGLKVKLISPDRDAPSSDLDGDGKVESWEQNRLLELVAEDGTAIDDHRFYTVATYDYLVGGGDDMSWFMNRIPDVWISKSKNAYGRDIVLDYIRKRKTINSSAQPLVNPDRPRIVFTD